MEDESKNDETFWFLDPSARPWLESVNQGRGWPYGVNGVNAENVHGYFVESMFCSIDSSNKSLQNETFNSPALSEIYWERKAFEANLATRSGTEYVVVDGPEKSNPNMNPVWVIQKQMRIKDRTGGEDDVKVSGHFYVVGDLVFQAASMFDLITMRITSLQHELSSLYKTAAKLPFYSIERGHYYTLPVQKKSSRGIESAQSSRAGSELPDTASQVSTRTAAKETTHKDDDRNIEFSFNLTRGYGGEYMDENPLIGEPGSFKMSTTSRNVRDKHAKDAEAEKDVVIKSEVDGQKTSVAPSPALPPPKSVMERKGSANGKIKSVTSASVDGVKKRRKSRAPGTPGLISPS